MPGKRVFTAGPDDEGRRLDRVLRILLEGLPLSAIYKALRQKRITLNGRKADPSILVAAGDTISVDGALVPPGALRTSEAVASVDRDMAAADGIESITLFRSPDLLIVNKPRGIPTHGKGSLDSLVRGLHAGDREASLAFSPAPLHRLDRNTSGALAFSLSIRGAHAFTAALRGGGIRKTYLALVDGFLDQEETWDDLLERDEGSLVSEVSEIGERAVTKVRPLLRSAARSLLLATLETGRTHQVRAQAKAHGHSLSGDAKYGGSPLPSGYILHAWRLDFFPGLLPGLPERVVAPLPVVALAVLEREFGAEPLATALRRA